MRQIVLGEPHRHGVDRLGDRRGQRHAAGIAAAVVLRRPVAPADRPVGYHRFRRQALLHRGRIGIDLERRARLPQRLGGAVELAGAVVAAADDGPHGAVVLQHHDGAFRDAVVLAVLAQVEFQRFLGGLLQVEVDGGARHHRVDAVFAGDALGLVEGVVEEIVGGLAVAAVDDVGRMQPRREHLALGEEAALHHVGQHLVGAGARRRQVDVRRVFGRRLEQAGQHRRLGQRQVLDVLAEIEIGALPRCRTCRRPYRRGRDRAAGSPSSTGSSPATATGRLP